MVKLNAPTLAELHPEIRDFWMDTSWDPGLTHRTP